MISQNLLLFILTNDFLYVFYIRLNIFLFILFKYYFFNFFIRIVFFLISYFLTFEKRKEKKRNVER